MSWFRMLFSFLRGARASEERKNLRDDLKTSYSLARGIADARRDPLLERDLAASDMTPPAPPKKK